MLSRATTSITSFKISQVIRHVIEYVPASGQLINESLFPNGEKIGKCLLLFFSVHAGGGTKRAVANQRTIHMNGGHAIVATIMKGKGYIP